MAINDNMYKFGEFARKVRVALTPRFCFLRTTLSNGAVVLGRNRAGFGGRGIYVFRDALEPELQHLERLLPEAGVFVDVGANTGVYTLKAAKHFSDQGVVLALEPFLDVLNTLERSVDLNGFSNVRLRNLCAGRATSASIFWKNFGEPHNFSSVKNDAHARPLSVLTVALDDLFEWEKLDRLDYLKVDVEGGEAEVLAGATKIVQRYRPIIQVEVQFKDVNLELADYAVWHAPNSVNRLYVPKEHPQIAALADLGWQTRCP